jgi:hypothetical protein
MASKTDSPGKVSPALAATLADLPETASVRVVLLLNVPTRTPSRRLTAEERAQVLSEARTATSGLLEQLRPTLDAAGARRVDDGGLSPLGGVVVDVPAGSVSRLAHAEQVRAILGDQPLALPEGFVRKRP